MKTSYVPNILLAPGGLKMNIKTQFVVLAFVGCLLPGSCTFSSQPFSLPLHGPDFYSVSSLPSSLLSSRCPSLAVCSLLSNHTPIPAGLSPALLQLFQEVLPFCHCLRLTVPAALGDSCLLLCPSPSSLRA